MKPVEPRPADEPTIPEAAVEGALGEWYRKLGYAPVERMRAALAAAEPLMHEGCEPAGAGWRALEQAHAENARLREALEEFVSIADAFPGHPLGPNIKRRFADGFRAALAPSDESQEG